MCVYIYIYMYNLYIQKNVLYIFFLRYLNIDVYTFPSTYFYLQYLSVYISKLYVWCWL